MIGYNKILNYNLKNRHNKNTSKIFNFTGFYAINDLMASGV
jgi:hypothetical protein